LQKHDGDSSIDMGCGDTMLRCLRPDAADQLGVAATTEAVFDVSLQRTRTTRMTRRHRLLLSFIAVVICTPSSVTLADGIPPHLPVSDLGLRTVDGRVHHFRVSLATRPADRQRGLMFVTELADDQGMLFDNGRPAIPSMWMKNTPLSLDMLFIRADGSISSIARETVPYSRALILSAEPVRAVLELKGGTCERLGIEPGDTVLHPLFGDKDSPPSAGR
jgi:uncharacterized membrane protein (UPF0127 family)